MPEDTTVAIQALVEQVQTLTERLDAQEKRLDNLHEFNGRILDEKKDAVRRARALEKRIEASGGKPPMTISREAARTPHVYERAVDKASRAGVELLVLD